MMGTEIFKIDASWAEKLTKTRVSFLMTPTVMLNKFDKILFYTCHQGHDLSLVLWLLGVMEGLQIALVELKRQNPDTYK